MVVQSKVQEENAVNFWHRTHEIIAKDAFVIVEKVAAHFLAFCYVEKTKIWHERIGGKGQGRFSHQQHNSQFRPTFAYS